MSNVYLQQGINFDNELIIDKLNLVGEIQDIDKAGYDAMELNNFMSYIQEGMNEEQARLKAKQHRSAAMSNARKSSKMT